MRTTVRIDDGLLKQAKQLAARKGCTLTSIIEEGLVIIVNSERVAAEPRKRVTLPVSTQGGGVLPGVDLTNSASLEAMDDYKWSSPT